CALAPAATRRIWGMPSEIQRTEPPVASATGARMLLLARISATSFGFSGPAAVTAESLPSLKRYSPNSSALALPRQTPGSTLSSTSSGRLLGPLITAWPDTWFTPKARNQPPQLGAVLSLLLPGRSRVTGWASPAGVTTGLNGPVTTSPVGWAGSTLASGVRK